MTDAHVTDRLNDYVEGLLAEADQRAVETHLAECLACRREEHGLRAVMARLQAAPRSIEPDRDLWSGIAARIGGVAPARVSRFRFPVSRIAAAAVLVIATATITLFLTRQKQAQVPTLAPYLAVEASYRPAAAELSQALDRGRGRLAPATVAALERNLALIDQAIRDMREALARDPGNRTVLELYASAYQQKLDLLRGAARAATPM